MIHIRNGVWETNSSTVHQFILTKESIDDIAARYSSGITEPLIIRYNPDVINDGAYIKTCQGRLDVYLIYAINFIADDIEFRRLHKDEDPNANPDGAYKSHISVVKTILNALNELYPVSNIADLELILDTEVNRIYKDPIHSYYPDIDPAMFPDLTNSKDTAIRFILGEESWYWQKDHGLPMFPDQETEDFGHSEKYECIINYQ